ncbi:MAG TPA: DUF2252 domain-containing protein [Candidatus Dormibacteraeota bacterium]|nr:DUF2252 domain-containing protein [Candidatus Dormibacteraeota bacterium]
MPRTTMRVRAAHETPAPGDHNGEGVERLAAATVDERVRAGKVARKRAPLDSHSVWRPPPGRPDPVALLEGQAKTRVPELVPIRYGRMLVSPFAFYRGAAVIMASDLANTPNSGFRAQLVGDAHMSNFGGFASAERTLVFDVNDFDETLPGPWEWDLKRLTASLEIAGREFGMSNKKRRKVVGGTVDEYQSAMHNFAERGHLDVWYAQLDVARIEERWGEQLGGRVRRNLRGAQARAKDNQRALEKLTHRVGGNVRFVSTPPLIESFDDLFARSQARRMDEEMLTYLRAYGESLSDDRRAILARFKYSDLARKVVGVGSVGTRTNIALFLGRDDGDPLVLQVKEANESVLEPYAGKSVYRQHGRRVVEGQRLIQASHDILLGWMRGRGIDGAIHDYYVRQLWDWKVSPEPEGMKARELRVLGEACAWTLARAHARTGDRVGISSYMDGGPEFAEAINEFAVAYADQNELDYKALVDAVDKGRITAQTGI